MDFVTCIFPLALRCISGDGARGDVIIKLGEYDYIRPCTEGGESAYIGPRPLIIAAHRLMAVCIHQQQRRPPSVQLALCADHNASGPIGSQYYQQTPLLAHTHRGIRLRDQLTVLSKSRLWLLTYLNMQLLSSFCYFSSLKCRYGGCIICV